MLVNDIRLTFWQTREFIPHEFQVELEIVTKHLDWKDEEVKTLFECEILDRVVFTSDLHKKSDLDSQSQHNHKEENQDVTVNGFYNEAEDLPDNTR